MQNRLKMGIFYIGLPGGGPVGGIWAYMPRLERAAPRHRRGSNGDQGAPNTPSVAGELEIELTDANYTEYTLEGADCDFYAVLP